MSGAFRLPQGGRIARTRQLGFRFDGRAFDGCAGDTLASALLANGVHLVGRSFKYHRPRGILAAGADEPNALVGVGAEPRYTPNLRATQVELYDGLVAESQNRSPSLVFDVGAVKDFASPLFPAGFYYKTFMWPAGAWKHVYEPAIRSMAGMGRAPTSADPARYLPRFVHCDVLVVGAGPAGLAAALAAAESNARVIVCDEQSEFGGSLLSDPECVIDRSKSAHWLTAVHAGLARRERVTLLPRTTAFGYFAHNFLGLLERVTDHFAHPDRELPRERLWQVRAREVVLATGAIERPLLFAGNDRPGIMLCEAVRTYLNRYAVKPGGRAVVATAHDAAYRTALDLARCGVEVAAIVDARTEVDGALPAAARALGLQIMTGTVVSETKGRLRVRAAKVQPLAGGSSAKWIDCDLIAMSGGFTPSVHLFSQSRGKLAFDAAVGAYVPQQSVERERSAGACRGVYALDAALADGYAAGASAVNAAGCRTGPARRFATSAQDAVASNVAAFVPALEHVAGKAFVDFQHDVTVDDIKLATREGFRSVEHVKRYTTAGMATDQGKTSNLNAHSVLANVLGKDLAQIGVTTFRMPYTPVSFGALAGLARGQLFDPVRTTPIHRWAEQAGTRFEDVGQWKRARYFPRGDETIDQAVARECRAVRNSVGIFDASTLGKIEVVGADAAEFLNRMYVNTWDRLEPGRCRYGLMLREDGFILDDGVVARVASDRFHVTTTTGGAARVLALMEDYLQTEWPQLDVWLTSTTEQWAVIALQGPRARDVLAPLVEGVDCSAVALPHMAMRSGRIVGVPTRLFRVSFTGELGFEVNVPAQSGLPVWKALLESGRQYGITPYGTEAMHVLRAEKGYIIVGQETDGTVTPDDVGLAGLVGKNKKDFVGKRSLVRPAMMQPNRKQLVGLLSADGKTLLDEGVQLSGERSRKSQRASLGHVTSSYFSPTLAHPIALAMVSDGHNRVGSTLYAMTPGRDLEVTLVGPVFFDPEGTRVNA